MHAHNRLWTCLSAIAKRPPSGALAGRRRSVVPAGAGTEEAHDTGMQVSARWAVEVSHRPLHVEV
jgi:hypothetical protein